MPSSSSTSVTSVVEHYMRKMERHESEPAVLAHALDKLDRVKGVSIAVLQETGIGRAVNALKRHQDSDVSTKAKALVAKWKDLVTREEEEQGESDQDVNDNDVDANEDEPPAAQDVHSIELANHSEDDSKVANHSHQRSSSSSGKSKSSHSHRSHSHKHKEKDKDKMKDTSENDDEKRRRRKKEEEREKKRSRHDDDGHSSHDHHRDRHKSSSRSKHREDAESSSKKPKSSGSSRDHGHSSSKREPDSSRASLGSSKSGSHSQSKSSESSSSSSKSAESKSANGHSSHNGTSKLLPPPPAAAVSKIKSTSSTSSSSSSLSIPSDISPHYKPLPQVPVQRPRKPLGQTEDEALSALIAMKGLNRTAVYSGTKRSGYKIGSEVPSLFQRCIEVLQEHVDDIEECGGLDYNILRPVLERAGPTTLARIEEINPYLMSDTGPLWDRIVQRHFPKAKREEMESPRELYERCIREREEKLESLKSKVKDSYKREESSVKKAKLAYVDTVAKAPRNIRNAQAKNGTALPVGHPLKRAIGPPAPSPSSSSSSAAKKPKIAPLMSKTLKMARGMKVGFRR